MLINGFDQFLYFKGMDYNLGDEFIAGETGEDEFGFLADEKEKKPKDIEINEEEDEELDDKEEGKEEEEEESGTY